MDGVAVACETLCEMVVILKYLRDPRQRGKATYPGDEAVPDLAVTASCRTVARVGDDRRHDHRRRDLA